MTAKQARMKLLPGFTMLAAYRAPNIQRFLLANGATTIDQHDPFYNVEWMKAAKNALALSSRQHGHAVPHKNPFWIEVTYPGKKNNDFENAAARLSQQTWRLEDIRQRRDARELRRLKAAKAGPD